MFVMHMLEDEVPQVTVMSPRRRVVRAERQLAARPGLHAPRRRVARRRSSVARVAHDEHLPRAPRRPRRHDAEGELRPSFE